MLERQDPPWRIFNVAAWVASQSRRPVLQAPLENRGKPAVTHPAPLYEVVCPQKAFTSVNLRRRVLTEIYIAHRGWEFQHRH